VIIDVQECSGEESGGVERERGTSMVRGLGDCLPLRHVEEKVLVPKRLSNPRDLQNSSLKS
jgi:hypothetical protein